MKGLLLSRAEALDLFSLSVHLERGAGTIVYDDLGGGYLDALSQYGSLPFGHADDDLSKACQTFFKEKFTTITQPLPGKTVTTLIDRLKNVTGGQFTDVVLSLGGADTVEVALKVVKAHSNKSMIIVLESAFHGKTSATLQLSDNPDALAFFSMEKDHHVCRLSIDDIDQFKERLRGGDVAAVFVELVQGEGGMVALPKEHVRTIDHMCKEMNVPLVVDEIQTGLGRTGTLFAYQQYGILPDLLLLSKALGAGVVPIGACLVRSQYYPTPFDIFHSATYGKNNFSASVALHVLDRLDDAFIHEIKRKGEKLGGYLQRLCDDFPDVFSKTTGIGLMRGIYLAPWPHSEFIIMNLHNELALQGYLAASYLLREHRLITMPCMSEQRCLRIQPPLVCSDQHLEMIFDALSEMALSIRQTQKQCLYSFLFSKKSMKALISQGVCHSPFSNDLRLESQPDYLFVIHVVDNAGFYANLPPVFQHASESEKRHAHHWLEKTRIASEISLSKWYVTKKVTISGKVLVGLFVGIYLYPDEMLQLEESKNQRLLHDIGSLAKDVGVTTVGLGAYSSIVAMGGFKLRHLNRQGISITAGSSMTAYAAFEAWRRQRYAPSRSFAIVGVNGDIGKLLLTQGLEGMLLGDLTEVTLHCLYNPANPDAASQIKRTVLKVLRAILADHDDQGKDVSQLISVLETHSGDDGFDAMMTALQSRLGFLPLECHPSDNCEVISRCDDVFVCTNHSGQLTSLASIKEGGAIFDVSIPSNVPEQLLDSDSVGTFHAGLFKYSTEITFGDYNICGFPPGICLGCHTETMLMASIGTLLPFKSGYDYFLRMKSLAKHIDPLELQPTILDLKTKEEVNENIFNKAKKVFA